MSINVADVADPHSLNGCGSHNQLFYPYMNKCECAWLFTYEWLVELVFQPLYKT